MGPSLSPAVRRMPSFARDSLLPHLVGGATGGLAAGCLAAGIAAVIGLLMPEDLLRVVIAASVLFYGLAALVGREPWRPRVERQVPEGFRRTPYHRTTAFLWGVDLGFGWSTRQPSSAYFVAFLATLVVAPTVAVFAGLAFGITRALTILPAARGSTLEEVEARYDAVRAYTRLPAVVTAFVATALSIAIIGSS